MDAGDDCRDLAGGEIDRPDAAVQLPGPTYATNESFAAGGREIGKKRVREVCSSRAGLTLTLPVNGSIAQVHTNRELVTSPSI